MFDSVENVDATRSRGAKSGEKSGGGAGEADENIHRLGRGEEIALTGDTKGEGLGVSLHSATELAHGFSH